MNNGTQGSLFTGQELRDTGIKAAIDHAESEAPGWAETAHQILHAYTTYYGGEFTCEDVVLYAEKYSLIGPAPDSRAWGGVFKSAAHEGLIKPSGGFRESRVPKHHCAPKRLWTKA